MRGSVVTSAILHAIVLAIALLSLGSPPPFEVQPTEALPVDIVPIEELTQIQQGEKTAPLKEKSSPKATKRQDKVDNAENVGDNNVDLKNPPTPSQRPPQTEVAAAPKPADIPKPQENQTNDVKDIQKEQTAAPAPSDVPTPTPEPTPAKAEPTPPKPTPEPKPEPKPADTAKAEETPKPDAVPLPSSKPTPEKPKQEEAKKEPKVEDKPKPVEKPKTEAKDAKAEAKNQPKSETKTASVDKKPGKDKEKKETAKSSSSRETDKIADEVAALLNKEDSAGGGAKRSNQEASLGGKKTIGAGKLSQTELDALKGAIQNNWNVIPGMMDAANIRIRVSFHLDRSGEIVGDPEVTVTGGEGSARDVLASSAKRAVLKSAPFKSLPADKYDTWSDVVVNFDPSDFM